MSQWKIVGAATYLLLFLWIAIASDNKIAIIIAALVAAGVSFPLVWWEYDAYISRKDEEIKKLTEEYERKLKWQREEIERLKSAIKNPENEF